MKVLVVGKNGQVARALSARSHGQPGLDLIHVGRPELDLESTSQIAEAIAAQAPDAVINAAAQAEVDQAECDPQRAHVINALGAEQIALGAAMAGAPIFQISTDYVFDGQLHRAYAEGDRTAPLNVYGRTKLDGERRVAAATPRHIIARTAWVYSPWGKNFVSTMLRLATEREEVSVVTDQWGSPTSALDLADAILAMVQQMHGAAASDDRWGVYHVAGSGTASWFDVAGSTFESLAGLGYRTPVLNPVPTSAYPTVAVRPRRTALDCRHLADEMGLALPEWRHSLGTTVSAILNGGQPV